MSKNRLLVLELSLAFQKEKKHNFKIKTWWHWLFKREVVECVALSIDPLTPCGRIIKLPAQYKM